MKRRIISMLAVLSKGDAVSNDAVAIHRLLEDAGYETVFCAERAYYEPTGIKVVSATDLSFICESDVVLYHLSTGTDLNYRFGRLKCKKIIRYHNITPPFYFQNYTTLKVASSMDGLYGAKYLADKADYCICVSDYNRQDLIRMNYRCPMDVMPILIAFDDYQKKPDEKVLNDMKNTTDIIFTGRIAPNKRHEDVIQAFYYYQKYYNADARLHLVGNPIGMEPYYQKLLEYVERLGVKNVHFTGHIPFSEMLAYYAGANLLLCMSDHEGFCVPLVEAMYFSIPILAKDAAAVGETLGGSGILLKDNNPLEAAALMNRVLQDDSLRNTIIQEQHARLSDFSSQKVQKQCLELMEKFLSQQKL